MIPAPWVSSDVMMESAFMALNTVMAIQTARTTLMNLTVVRYLLKLHIINNEIKFI
jgi:hypothetical protein